MPRAAHPACRRRSAVGDAAGAAARGHARRAGDRHRSRRSRSARHAAQRHPPATCPTACRGCRGQLRRRDRGRAARLRRLRALVSDRRAASRNPSGSSSRRRARQRDPAVAGRGDARRGPRRAGTPVAARRCRRRRRALQGRGDGDRVEGERSGVLRSRLLGAVQSLEPGVLAVHGRRVRWGDLGDEAAQDRHGPRQRLRLRVDDGMAAPVRPAGDRDRHHAGLPRDRGRAHGAVTTAPDCRRRGEPAGAGGERRRGAGLRKLSPHSRSPARDGRLRSRAPSGRARRVRRARGAARDQRRGGRRDDEVRDSRARHGAGRRDRLHGGDAPDARRAGLRLAALRSAGGPRGLGGLSEEAPPLRRQHLSHQPRRPRRAIRGRAIAPRTARRPSATMRSG